MEVVGSQSTPVIEMADVGDQRVFRLNAGQISQKIAGALIAKTVAMSKLVGHNIRLLKGVKACIDMPFARKWEIQAGRAKAEKDSFGPNIKAAHPPGG